MSPFGALTTALAATIGTGNIYGVAGAVLLGGPGAVLWMWLTGVFGIATKYAEALLAVKYRVKNERGEMAGGPMYVLEHALGMRWLGVLFAALHRDRRVRHRQHDAGQRDRRDDRGAGARRSRSGSSAPSSRPLTAAVILGGIRSIARVCELLVPFMTVFYVAGCLIILAIDWQRDPGRARADLHERLHRTGGGGRLRRRRASARRCASASRAGCSRTSPGLGSAPIVAAAARSENPGAPGAGVLDRDLLGHRRGVRDDRARGRHLGRLDAAPT